MKVNSVSSALTAIQRQSGAAERAADKLARATTTPSQPQTSGREQVDSTESQHQPQVLDGTVEMMVAKRMFTAAVRMAQTANEGIAEALRIGGYDVAA